MAEAKRRRRGPAPTDRDWRTMRWLGEQFAARTDVLAVLLGRMSPVEGRAPGPVGERTVRHHAERWQAMGLVQQHHLLGSTWVTPKAAGLRLAGLGFEPWTPAPVQLAHVHAVGVVRLWVEQEHPELAWINERTLRREHTPGGLVPTRTHHVADGALAPPGAVDDDDPFGSYAEPRALVEVELNQKADKRLRAAILKTPPYPVPTITYFTPPTKLEAIRGQVGRALDALAAEGRSRLPEVRVVELPRMPGVSYLNERWW